MKKNSKMLKKIRKVIFFNMVEIALAFGIIGVGVGSIMSLISVGISSSKDAIGDNNAPAAAQNFISYFERYLINNWTANVVAANNNFPASAETHVISKTDTLEEVNSDFTFGDNSNSNDDIRGLKIWEDSGNYRGLFRYNLAGDGGSGFKCDIRVWKDKVFAHIGSFSGNMSYAYATAIMVEVSWPVEVAYSQRQKRYYRYEIFKPGT